MPINNFCGVIESIFNFFLKISNTTSEECSQKALSQDIEKEGENLKCYRYHLLKNPYYHIMLLNQNLWPRAILHKTTKKCQEFIFMM